VIAAEDAADAAHLLQVTADLHMYICSVNFIESVLSGRN
jgi:hypothetical protein